MWGKSKEELICQICLSDRTFFAVPELSRQIQIQDCAESRSYKGLPIAKHGSHTSLISLIKVYYEKCAPSSECASLELTVPTVLPRNVCPWYLQSEYLKLYFWPSPNTTVPQGHPDRITYLPVTSEVTSYIKKAYPHN